MPPTRACLKHNGSSFIGAEGPSARKSTLRKSKIPSRVVNRDQLDPDRGNPAVSLRTSIASKWNLPADRQSSRRVARSKPGVQRREDIACNAPEFPRLPLNGTEGPTPVRRGDIA